jgi:hypothetical protein
VDRAVDATATEQLFVRGVDDRVDRFARDVTARDVDQHGLALAHPTRQIAFGPLRDGQ